MNILVINGVNLNMIGIREPEIYGNITYKDFEKDLYKYMKTKGVKGKIYQSNSEGCICTEIQKAYKKYHGIIINAGAYTHTSIAILDALKAVQIPTVEVHISKVFDRESYRSKSYISEYAEKVIVGKGLIGYKEAIDYLIDRNEV